MDRADWQQQQEAERERLLLTIEALEAAKRGEATKAHIEHLARECGVTKSIVKGITNEMVG